MKKLILIAATLLASTAVCAKTIKHDVVRQVPMKDVSLEAYRDLDGVESVTFRLWGWRKVTETQGKRVVVFSGNAEEMHRFIRGIESLGREYPKTDDVSRVIEGIWVNHTYKLRGGFYLRGDERAVAEMLEGEFADMRVKFFEYCVEHDIKYE